jgi:uncharacterized LabA/DUF88 family protein
MPSSDRTIFFVDGSNFYNNLKEIGVHANPIDIEKVAVKLAMGRNIIQIRYYIPELERSAGQAFVANRDLIAFLRTKPLIHISLGYMQKSEEPNPCAAEILEILPTTETGIPGRLLVLLNQLTQRHKTITVYEEKGVDVALACDMVEMAIEDRYDLAYLISADGDFFPAVKIAQQRGKRVFAAGPKIGIRLQQTCDKAIALPRAWFSDCTIAKRAPTSRR